MKIRWRLLLVGLGLTILLAAALLVGRREEPVYQGKPLRYWVTRLGSDDFHGPPKDAVAAVQAIGPKAVPFLLDWMPQREPRRQTWLTRVWQWCADRHHISTQQQENDIPTSDCVKIAWWVLGTKGKPAIPELARMIKQPLRSMDDYSAWSASADAISYLGPDAIVPMLTAAT